MNINGLVNHGVLSRNPDFTCLDPILSEVFLLNTSDANDACEYVEVLRRFHHAPRRATHVDFEKRV
jgi:hypothetical protein